MRRRTWWIASMATGVGYYAVWAILTRILWSERAALPEYSQPMLGDPLAPLLLNAAVTSVGLAIQIAIGTRRAHDLNRAGWEVVVINVAAVLVSYAVGYPTDEAFGDPLTAAFAVLWILSSLGSLYLMIRLGFMDGTPGPNRYGRSPKGIGGDPADETAKVFS